MGISIQRGFIKQNVSVDEYYMKQMKRALDDKLERVVMINGIRTLRRSGMLEHRIATFRQDGEGNSVLDKSTERTEMQPDDRLWMILSGTDLVTITNLKPATEFDRDFEILISSFTRR
jgi:hypothetical protein